LWIVVAVVDLISVKGNCGKKMSNPNKRKKKLPHIWESKFGNTENLRQSGVSSLYNVIDVIDNSGNFVLFCILVPYMIRILYFRLDILYICNTIFFTEMCNTIFNSLVYAKKNTFEPCVFNKLNI
jgi:hypothetical protein